MPKHLAGHSDTRKAKRQRVAGAATTADQCVKSRLQVKMNAPDSIKQEETEDHPHLNTLHMVVCKEEVPAEQERSHSLLQEEPEPPHIKEEQEELKEEEEELLQRPEEPDGSIMTLFAVKSEEKDDGEEDISSHCFEIEVELESDTEVTDDKEVTDDWEKTTRSLCDKRFSDHTGEKPFHCKLCNKSFNESGHLKNHQRVHTGEKPFHCRRCCRSFSEESFLKMHLRIHNGEKPFHCKSCGGSFSNSHELKQHIEQGRERDKTGEREGVRSQSQFFSCSVCSYALTSQVFLHKHIRLRHSDLYCQMLRNGQIID